MLAEWLKSLPRPCGIFAANDATAAEVCTMASSFGISIPDELAVIGVDDDPIICERTKPSLSSIRVDFEQGGYICAELLDRRIHDPHFTQASFTYGTVLVARRGSTRRMACMDRRVVKALEYIRKNACEGIGTTDVAAVMDVSRRMAEAIFRRKLNRSIHEEIVLARLERAKLLLCNPRHDISSIAGLCGWSSESVLRKTFKERFGVSMREWRTNRQSL
jgi:LacI family transcriptional regulator